MHPFSDNEADVEAAHREDGSRNRWFLEPVLGRECYPEDMLERYAEILPTIEDGDMDTIAAPLDFLGINYYTRSVVRAERRRGPRPRGRSTPRWAGRCTRTASIGCSRSSDRVRAPRALHHREWRRVRGCARERACRRFQAGLLSRGASRRGRSGNRRGRPCAGLLSLVAARQFRVGVRLLAPLRDRVRGLRYARAGAEGQLHAGIATSSRPSGPGARSYAANVVFPSAALVDAERVSVYYGGADTVICLATATSPRSSTSSGPDLADPESQGRWFRFNPGQPSLGA